MSVIGESQEAVRIHVACAVCRHMASRWRVKSELNPLGETVTFSVECHGAREVIEWMPVSPVLLGPLVVTAFLAGDASPLSHLGEWSRMHERAC